MEMNPMMQQQMMMNFNNQMNPMMEQMMLNPNIQQMIMNLMMNPNMQQNPMMQQMMMNQDTNYYEYKIIHNEPLKEKNLKRNEINLSLFFNGITNFEKKIYKNGNKILLNYYNLEKIEIYVDFDLKVKEIISMIFGCIFFPSDLYIYKNYKRTKDDQNTQYITSFPQIFYKDYSNIFSKKTFYLEYKNKNLLELSNKTGIEIGLKNGDEILLKLDENYLNQLISLPLDGLYLNLSLDKRIYLSFPTFDGELTEEFKKRLSYILNNKINYQSLPTPCILRNKRINKYDINGIFTLSFYSSIIGGEIPIDFVDVSKGKIQNLEFSKSAPKWRKVQEGLNIFGICCNPQCKAYKKEVIFIPHLEEDKHIFNLNDNITNILCPICHLIIKIKTCGFWKCEYQFIGAKIEKGKLENFDSGPKETKDNEFEYFDPSGNGNVTWTKLIIYVIPKQKIKYNSNLKSAFSI